MIGGLSCLGISGLRCIASCRDYMCHKVMRKRRLVQQHRVLLDLPRVRVKGRAEGRVACSPGTESIMFAKRVIVPVMPRMIACPKRSPAGVGGTPYEPCPVCTGL